ncbi:glycolate oxidase iron-sulfur subunit [Kushneria sinocarnis]|uniref:Glycolate oxidase iron-sulfur subunit n=1 Tax=Kushneria sinocarnis TaxID=595502 RepID=A0A420X0Q2_9GAMM|nr:glycolate oxidase subunit GlcF [Kushneria sinocarnis]RKR07279.1 glycolate oxidase iron-sulfur subunit [Kushneria sinocarnis]
MQTALTELARSTREGRRADEILRSCVHCGFCNATCPTYQLLGDELDGPRGRIYLMKEVLEGHQATRSTQTHLDRCLNCRNCETTCPSGVRYHELLDLVRPEVERQVGRAPRERAFRYALRHALVEPQRFRALLRTGLVFRPLLPDTLRTKLPPTPIDAGSRPPASRHERQVLLLEGCVQPSLSPNTNAATARVLDRLGLGVTPVPEAGCCGAVDYHLDARSDGRDRARRNIDAWWPHIEAGAEAIVMTASGCGAFVREYGELLADDPDYAERAERVAAMTCDLVELIGQATQLDALSAQLAATPAADPTRLACHTPCTLQHGQGLGGRLEQLLGRLGFELSPVTDPHLCCGSAGTYSITQPELSRQLRDDKLGKLQADEPEVIVTANIGCQSHLAAASRVPVRHWIELVDERLATTERAA